ncbi:MAG: DinB family protein [Dehalococcoidia bacterium]
MNAIAFFAETLERADGTLTRALDGLTTEELRRQVAGPDSNPIGWLTWHLTRSRDTIMSSVCGVKSLWETEWAGKFGMEANPPRYEPGNVHTFDPKDFDTIQGYFQAVAARTMELAKGLSESDLERMIESPMAGRPPASVAARLQTILNDNIQHMGQVAYLRGMLREQGWF